MNNQKKLLFPLILGVFLVFLPTQSASAEDGRFFIKSTSNFWRTALGARHAFTEGFTADLNDFQFRFARLFGVKVETVPVFSILPADIEAITDQLVNPATVMAASISDAVLPDTSASPPVPASGSQGITEPDTSGNGGKKPPPTTRNVPSNQTPWGIETVYNNLLIASASGGEGILIAVLDTGVDAMHPDLKERVSGCKDFTNFRKGVIDGSCDDKNGHGTHVSGIIAADAASDSLGIYGVAPESSLAVFKVCGNNGFCYADDIAVAIKTAANEGVNIINMSFGGDSNSSLIKSAVSYAYSKGVLMVAAAGNDGPFPDSIDYPAAYAEVMAIGAIDPAYDVMDWSSRGTNIESEPFVIEEKDIEFALPGENIESTWKDSGYAVLSGTSMASPFAAGLAAKLWQAEAENPMTATRELLHSLSLDINDGGDDDASGFGLPRLSN